MKLSKGMKKCLEDMKLEAIMIIDDIPAMQTLKLQRKPTKNKVFDFHIMNIGKPAIRVFINGKHYKNYILLKGRWTEGEKK